MRTILKKTKVTDGSSNQKRANKTYGIIYSEYISYLSFQCRTMIHDFNQPDRMWAGHIRSYFIGLNQNASSPKI